VFGRIFAIAGKELKHIVRDRRNLAFVLFMPVFMLTLFAYALSFDVRDVPTVVLDQDHTSQSRAWVDTLSHSSFFQVVAYLPNPEAVDKAFDSGKARAAIVVARGFGDDIVGGGKGRVAVLLDGSEPNSAQLGQSYASALASTFGRQITITGLERQGVQAGRFGGVEPHIRLWYNPEARSAAYLIPGLIVVIIMVVMVQQTATSLVREEDHGTLEQLLVSPLRRYELVVGKVLPWIGFAGLEAIAVTLVAIFFFGIPFRGNLLIYGAGVVLFLLSCLAIGILVSSRSGSVEVANQTALLISFLPAFMLSGFVFPLSSIPPVLQFVSYLFPARYMVVIARSSFLKGSDLAALWPQLAALAVYAVVGLTLATVSYRNKLR
jgi:ABC-2 type transport system permease protein